MTEPIPEKCEGCLERDADPKEEWWVSYSKSYKLCQRCARLLAKRFPDFLKETCGPKISKGGLISGTRVKGVRLDGGLPLCLGCGMPIPSNVTQAEGASNWKCPNCGVCEIELTAPARESFDVAKAYIESVCVRKNNPKNG